MKIQQAAFAAGKPFQKGALHCHSTRSDGKGSPEEVIRLHAQNGYTFMALTDHDNFNRINYAQDVPMTMLSGVERELNLPGPSRDMPRCVHIVGVGDPQDPRGPEQDERIPHYGDSENPLDAQGMIEQMHTWGLHTFYCHPEWSGTAYADYKGLKGNFAMEIWNSGCVLENEMDVNNGHYLDEAWDDGNYLNAVAVDDGHAMDQHCLGWVMVSAENNAGDILSALDNGAFYASCGPEIEDFYVEDGMAYLKCSGVRSIAFHSLRYALRRTDGIEICEAECCLPKGLKYVRATVVDHQGRRAWTNPILLR